MVGRKGAPARMAERQCPRLQASSPPSSPGFRGVKQRLRHRAIIGLEEAERGRIVLVCVGVQAVVDREHAARHAALPPREQRFHVGVLEKGILLRREPFVLGETQWWNPVGIAPVALVCVIDEPAEVAPLRGYLDVNHCQESLIESCGLRTSGDGT